MGTRNFTDAELECRCGCGALPPRGFQIRLQALRERYGRPMPLSSAARCPDHNLAVSKTGRDGPHTKGAVDVLVAGKDAFDLVECALRLSWTGVGISQKGSWERRFIHLDALQPLEAPRPRVWSY